MPSDDLPRGTVCVPHLPEGDVILTRYPSWWELWLKFVDSDLAPFAEARRASANGAGFSGAVHR